MTTPSMMGYAKPETPSISLDDIMDNLHGQVYITTVPGGQQGLVEGSGWVTIDRFIYTPEGNILFVVVNGGTTVNWKNIVSIRPLRPVKTSEPAIPFQYLTLDPKFPKDL